MAVSTLLIASQTPWPKAIPPPRLCWFDNRVLFYFQDKKSELSCGSRVLFFCTPVEPPSVEFCMHCWSCVVVNIPYYPGWGVLNILSIIKYYKVWTKMQYPFIISNIPSSSATSSATSVLHQKHPFTINNINPSSSTSTFHHKIIQIIKNSPIRPSKALRTQNDTSILGVTIWIVR